MQEQAPRNKYLPLEAAVPYGLDALGHIKLCSSISFKKRIRLVYWSCLKPISGQEVEAELNSPAHWWFSVCFSSWDLAEVFSAWEELKLDTEGFQLEAFWVQNWQHLPSATSIQLPSMFLSAQPCRTAKRGRCLCTSKGPCSCLIQYCWAGGCRVPLWAPSAVSGLDIQSRKLAAFLRLNGL